MAKIVPINQLQPAFQNAMDHLLRETEIVSVAEVLREWNKHFNCYLLHDSDFVWESVGFKDEEQISWFMLKWS